MFQQKRRRKMKRLRINLKKECTKGKKKKTPIKIRSFKAGLPIECIVVT
jgi:hypothetical protein